MTKEEQINEMANYYCEYYKKQTGKKVCEHIDDKSCNIFFEAELFYNAGYRKVLLDAENGKMVDCVQYAPWELIKGYTEREVKKARKGTAKEILDEVSKHYGGAWLVELYKKYGLKVEE